MAPLDTMPAPVISGVTFTSMPALGSFFSAVVATGEAEASKGAMPSVTRQARVKRLRRQVKGVGETCIVYSLLRLRCCVSTAAFFRLRRFCTLTCRKGRPFCASEGVKSLAFEHRALVQRLHGARVVGKPRTVAVQLVRRQLKRLLQDDPIDAFGARRTCD